MGDILVSKELLEAIRTFIGMARFELEEEFDEENLESQVGSILDKPETKLYEVVQWPESQELMDKSWFNECFLADNNTDKHYEIAGSSAYFVPVERVKELHSENK